MIARKILPFVLVLGALLSTSVLATAPAYAATTVTKKQSYSLAFDRWSPELKLCAHIVLEGNFKYKLTGPDTLNKYKISGAQIENPALRVWLKESCARTAPTIAVGTKATLVQRWYSPYGSCQLNPSISAGFPWSVSVSSTPACSNTGKTAQRSSSSSSSTKLSYFAQANTGSPASWSDSRAQTYCLMYTASVRIYKGGISDSFTIAPSLSGVCAYSPSS